ncbi:MAG: DUF4349 domain-containing protein [Acidobacteriia bacterium]|nr:DUF4349 domain-containing protein [Terriglobia bacterium]
MSKVNHPIEQEELMAYLDGELSPERMASTAAHLEQCRECQAVAGDLQGVSRNLLSWQVDRPDSPMRSDLAAAIEEFERDKGTRTSADRETWRDTLDPRRWPRWVWGLAGAGVLVLLFTLPRPVMDHKSALAPSVNRTEPEGSQDAVSHYSSSSDGALRAPKQEGGAGAGTAGKLPMGERYSILGQRGDVTTVNGKAQALLQEESKKLDSLTSQGPLIVRTADLSLTTQEFNKVRAGVEQILKRHHGYIGELSVSTPAGAARTLTATLRVPTDQMDATIVELRTLGRVETESQGGEEVTQEYMDLEARFTNARNTEKRLTDVLRQRTGKLSDILEVEQAIDRVRGEIESMRAEKERLTKRVNFATLKLSVKEDYKAQLQTVPASSLTQLHNAAVEGYQSMIGGVFGMILGLVSYGPSFLFWGGLLLIPGRMAWKRLRRTRVQ